MATNGARGSTKRSPASKKPAARKPSAKTTARSTSSRASAAGNGSKRGTSTASRRSTTTRSSGNGSQRATTSSRNGNGVIDTAKNVAGKAAAPAVAVGAAAVGIAGGIALKSRKQRKTVLGVKLPQSIGKSLSDVDARSIAKSIGQASKQFAKTTKGVSKDLERAGDQAERIGKILD
jgi:hypothetical protein